MTYPIVDDRPLIPAARQHPSGQSGRHRKAAEPPGPATHHVLVYQVDGHYVAGRADRGPEAHQLATHVTTVDVRREAVTVVDLAVPAADAGSFTVTVTFRCTVANPVTVVREGVDDIGAILTGYLRRHSRIFQIGRGHPLSEADRFTANVRNQIAAYVVFMPPNIDGMVIALADVEVSTPAAAGESTPPASTRPTRRADVDPPQTPRLSLGAGHAPTLPTRPRQRGI